MAPTCFKPLSDKRSSCCSCFQSKRSSQREVEAELGRTVSDFFLRFRRFSHFLIQFSEAKSLFSQPNLMSSLTTCTDCRYYIQSMCNYQSIIPEVEHGHANPAAAAQCSCGIHSPSVAQASLFLLTATGRGYHLICLLRQQPRG